MTSTRRLSILHLFVCLLTVALPLHAADVAVVTVQPLESLLFHPQQEAPATLLSLNDSPLSLELSGIIQEISVQVGQRVQKGEPLLRLDPWLYQNQWQQAQVALEESQLRHQLAQRQQERTAQLHKKGQAPAEQWDQRATEVRLLAAQIKQQQALLQAAQDRLERVLLRAPFAGVISERQGQLGAYATAGVPLLRLTDQEQLELSAQIRAEQASAFDAAWEGHFLTGNQRYPVRWRTLLPVQNAQTRTRELRLTLVGPERPLPGAAGRLLWKAPHPHLPTWLLSRRGGQLGLFFAEADKARFHPLPQAVEGEAISVEGITTGHLILAGRQQLNDGDSIQVEEAR
ncbi:MAG: efflux RND transporter periplasmic adaptor subunit [Magnetococcales bacterium]|nr:efflux RND transporter periplasmic adaptor subunit [Magnetococcales bacterium]